MKLVALLLGIAAIAMLALNGCVSVNYHQRKIQEMAVRYEQATRERTDLITQDDRKINSLASRLDECRERK